MNFHACKRKSPEKSHQQKEGYFPPFPNEARLREVALAHVARFATTKKNLHLVLERRVRRWAILAEKAGMLSEEIAEKTNAVIPVIEKIITNLGDIGAVDDSAFAQSRGQRLLRSGRSRRATIAHLIAKGVDGDMAQQVMEEKCATLHEGHGLEAELGAALILARKRGVGPFQRPDRAAKELMKILALFARNGFSQEIAERVLGMERDEAEETLLLFKNA